MQLRRDTRFVSDVPRFHQSVALPFPSRYTFTQGESLLAAPVRSAYENRLMKSADFGKLLYYQ